MFLSQITDTLSLKKEPSNLFISDFAVDSRLVKKGSLFFALPGEKTDGHQFLEKASENGAIVAVVSKQYQGLSYGLKILKVENTLQALHKLAKIKLEHLAIKTVAITGSMGKTTTKDFLVTLLKRKFNTCYSPGNSNSQIGLPLNILNLVNHTHDVIVLEMGMSKPGEIATLIDIAPPSIALITSVALAHAANFSCLEAIALEKGSIFSNPQTLHGILPSNIPYFSSIYNIGTCRKTTFSIQDSKSDFYFPSLPNLNVLGKHNIHNALAACVTANLLGIDWQDILKFLSLLTLPEHRLQLIEKKEVLYVNDSYNANPSSMKAALESLPKPKLGKKTIAILGEMLELGQYCLNAHKEVAIHALKHVDYLICFGKKCRPMQEVWEKEKKPVVIVETFESLINELKNILEPGDVVLLKGSKAKELWRILDI